MPKGLLQGMFISCLKQDQLVGLNVKKNSLILLNLLQEMPNAHSHDCKAWLGFSMTLEFVMMIRYQFL